MSGVLNPAALAKLVDAGSLSELDAKRLVFIDHLTAIAASASLKVLSVDGVTIQRFAEEELIEVLPPGAKMIDEPKMPEGETSGRRRLEMNGVEVDPEIAFDHVHQNEDPNL